MPSGSRMSSRALAFAVTRRPSELLPSGTKIENDRRFGGIGVSPMAPASCSAPALTVSRSTSGAENTVTRFEALAKP